MNKKKVLLTGGSGLLALNWALSVKDSYEVVLGLHKKSAQLNGVESFFINMESVDKFSADIDRIQPDIVVHCAGLANVEICEANPADAWYVNVVLSGNVATACKRAGISFIYIATDHLFAGNKPLVTESEPMLPVNEYGRTKGEGEKLILDISQENLSIRTNFYGWGPSYRSSFSDMIIHNLRGNSPVFLFDDFFYTPILIDDLAWSTMQLYEKNAHGVFHVTGNERISKYDFGVKLADRFGLDKRLINRSRFSDRKDLVKRPRDLSLSNAKATKILGRGIGEIGNNIDALYAQEQNKLAARISGVTG